MRNKMFLAACIVNGLLILAFAGILFFYSTQQESNIRFLNDKVYKPIKELSVRKSRIYEMQARVHDVLFVDPSLVYDLNLQLWASDQNMQNLFDFLDTIYADEEDKEVVKEIKVDYEKLLLLQNEVRDVAKRRNRVEAKEFTDRISHVQGNLFALLDVKIEKCLLLEEEIEAIASSLTLMVVLTAICLGGLGLVFNAIMGIITILHGKIPPSG
ncbi:MAG: hypothetical protein JW904_04850 [Spirochaetales bacterium]|nr:hypothetical protein [Spirochaetales bacterium]